MKHVLPFLIAGLFVAVGSLTAEQDRPNIILIISDDHAFNDYGFMGHETVRTPVLDRMASESLLYTRGYVMPVCSPTLACLLTGQMPRHHGITGNDLAPDSPQIDGNRRNRTPLLERLLENSLVLPQALTDVGYLTFQTGKLWNATYEDVGFTHGMTDRQGRHGGPGLTIGRKGMQPIYDFIETAREADKPFFIWHAPFLPHTPHNPPEELLEKYRGKGPTPAAEKYFAMIEWLDNTCGELDAYLADNGLRENTVVIYLADNGWNDAKGTAGQRAKMSPYEGGIRTPFFVRWPGKVEPLRDEETLAHVTDVPVTLLNLANAAVPGDLSGIDLLARDAIRERETVFVESYTHDIADLDEPSESLIARVVINGWSKLIIPGPARPARRFATVPADIQLFDLKSDPFEENNLAADRPGEVQRLLSIQNEEWDGQ